jgi:hypothetical protein
MDQGVDEELLQCQRLEGADVDRARPFQPVRFVELGEGVANLVDQLEHVAREGPLAHVPSHDHLRAGAAAQQAETADREPWSSPVATGQVQLHQQVYQGLAFGRRL